MMTIRELIDRTEAALVMHFGYEEARAMRITTSAEVSSGYRHDELIETATFSLRVTRCSDYPSLRTVFSAFGDTTDELLDEIRTHLPPRTKRQPRQVSATVDDLIDGVIHTDEIEVTA